MGYIEYEAARARNVELLGQAETWRRARAPDRRQADQPDRPQRREPLEPVRPASRAT